MNGEAPTMTDAPAEQASVKPPWPESWRNPRRWYVLAGLTAVCTALAFLHWLPFSLMVFLIVWHVASDAPIGWATAIGMVVSGLLALTHQLSLLQAVGFTAIFLVGSWALQWGRNYHPRTA